MICNTCYDRRTVQTNDVKSGIFVVGPCPTCNKNGELAKAKDRSEILKRLQEV